ncbi:MAG: hypothetical protein ABI068_17080 [Ktedonobacterales bacterium]
MDAQMVLATARSGQAPANWQVWELRQDFLRYSMYKWGGLALIGFVIFIPALIVTVPSDFVTGNPLASAVTVVILAILGFIPLGSLGIVIYDLWRLGHARDYLLVMTPDDYVKAQPGKITHVPMEDIMYITLRGVKLPANYKQDVQGVGQMQSAFSRMFYGGWRTQNIQNRPRGAPSLAFLDRRTDKEVVVGTDESFDSLVALEQVLTLHVDDKEKQLRQASYSRS